MVGQCSTALEYYIVLGLSDINRGSVLYTYPWYIVQQPLTTDSMISYGLIIVHLQIAGQTGEAWQRGHERQRERKAG